MPHAVIYPSAVMVLKSEVRTISMYIRLFNRRYYDNVQKLGIPFSKHIFCICGNDGCEVAYIGNTFDSISSPHPAKTEK